MLNCLKIEARRTFLEQLTILRNYCFTCICFGKETKQEESGTLQLQQDSQIKNQLTCS
jgi:hypothetical protein